MISLLQSLSKTVHASLALAIILFFGLHFAGDGFAGQSSLQSELLRQYLL